MTPYAFALACWVGAATWTLVLMDRRTRQPAPPAEREPSTAERFEAAKARGWRFERAPEFLRGGLVAVRAWRGIHDEHTSDGRALEERTLADLLDVLEEVESDADC